MSELVSVTILLRPEQVRDFIEGWKAAERETQETDVVNLAVERGKKKGA